MSELKAIGWSMADLRELETFEDLLWWHQDAIKQHNRIHGSGSQK